jgi:AcrR family transcriptional regulator
MSPGDRSTRDSQRQQTRRRLYECALAVFRMEGVSNCRIEDIAKAAGVSRGAFYFHFPTKEDVLLERMRETETQICGAIDALPANAPLRRVLETLIGELVSIWESDPTLLPNVASTALYYTASTMADQEASRLRAVLCRRFRDAAERGELSARLPGDLLGDLYLGHMLAGLLAWYAKQALPLGTVLAGVTELFFAGAAAEPKKEGRKHGSDHRQRTRRHLK